jgi:hypothetical protein
MGPIRGLKESFNTLVTISTGIVCDDIEAEANNITDDV